MIDCISSKEEYTARRINRYYLAWLEAKSYLSDSQKELIGKHVEISKANDEDRYVTRKVFK